MPCLNKLAAGPREITTENNCHVQAMILKKLKENFTDTLSVHLSNSMQILWALGWRSRSVNYHTCDTYVGVVYTEQTVLQNSMRQSVFWQITVDHCSSSSYDITKYLEVYAVFFVISNCNHNVTGNSTFCRMASRMRSFSSSACLNSSFLFSFFSNFLCDSCSLNFTLHAATRSSFRTV